MYRPCLHCEGKRYNESYCPEICTYGEDKKRLKELEEQFKCFKWNHVEDQLPEEDVRVLVCVNSERSDTKMDTDRMLDGKWVRWGSDITHWMPLPEPPEVKE